MLNLLCIDFIVFAVGFDKFDSDDFSFVIDMDDQTVIITLNIENDTVIT